MVSVMDWRLTFPVVVEEDKSGPSVMCSEDSVGQCRKSNAWLEESNVFHAERLLVASETLHNL